MAYYSNMNPESNNHNGKKPISWWLILVLTLFGLWPIALGLTIFKLINEKNTSSFQTNWNGSSYRGTYHAGQQTSTGPHYASAAEKKGPLTPEEEANRRLKRYKTIAALFLLVGAIIGVTALPGLANTLQDISYGFFDSFTIRYDLIPALYSLVGGGGLMFLGSRMKRTLRRENLMVTITGNADNITIRQLSAASGYNQKQTMEILKDAIGHGLFGSDAYIDMRTKTLIVRGPAPEPQPKPAKPKKEPEPKKEEPKEAPKENPYTDILRQLRTVNDAIPGEEMSSKIDQLEDISARIFALIDKDPSKKAQLSKFMDYYLPTALKLLDTYATLDQQGLQGQNVIETKSNIENTMDMLVTAFAGQLDKLFQSDALDVSSDIAALQSMLAMDGLTADGLFHTPDSTAEQE